MEGKKDAERATRLVSIVVAPSARFAAVAPICATIARSEGVDSELEVRALDDLYELASARHDRGLLILDSDELALEDVGLVRRFATRNTEWRLAVVGNDATRASAKALLALARTRWLSWPLDLTQITELVRSAAPASVVVPRAGEADAKAHTGEGAAAATQLETQVSILADISQRLELAFSVWRESARPAESDIEAPAAELRRLLRFTRTLSCCIAPPSRGEDEFDPAALIDEQLATLALRGRKGPRFSTRGGAEARAAGGFAVRANRAAIAIAFEAVLGLASQCAAPGETVRVLYSEQDGQLAITVEFPAGALAGVSAERILDPAVMRERLPDFGPNELPAAAAILRSQGGELVLAEGGRGALAVQMRLGLARLSGSQAKPLARSSSHDPFA